MFKKPVPKELKQIHDDYKELKSFIGEEKAREVMKTEYPEMTKQEFSKLIITEDFRQPKLNGVYRTNISYKRELFKELMENEISIGSFYTTKELIEKVVRIAKQSGLVINNRKEISILECIYNINRAYLNNDSGWKIVKRKT